ncbi:MAG TPA: UDP-N-acetylmuramoyl-L-alanine--D-glutamate ligase [Candidatus Saccharimonadales bacterium]|nr:UDP-N-acetylmuramoyl-L-alanine--D-glutamate ligase [Candidatus Saccharimonadales bacterium]
MRIAILGYSLEGRSSYEYFKAQGGHDITICDADESIDVPEGARSALGAGYLDDLDQFDLLVRTAGLPPSAILEKSPGVVSKITSNLNEFLKACPTGNIIGITGTKGKGTTSTLVAKMLEAAGKQVGLGGNIGVPPLEMLPELTPDSWVVLELSSFQLMDIGRSPHIGVCLMVVPEHLDWHARTDEYFGAKANLFAKQSSEDIAIYFADNKTSEKIAAGGNGRKIPYFAAPGAVVEDGAVRIDGKDICKTDELKLLGRHNWQNVCAAVTTVWQVTQDTEALRSVLTGFGGIEHRLELVRELDGVRYYDDSYGTTPETATVAIEAFEKEPVIAILGGRPKGIPFDDLASFISRRSNVKQVIAIGETGPEIAELLRNNGFGRITTGANDMAGIVRQARELAEPGDVVLLSTANTSFDMFKNYKQRGEIFAKAVKSLS